MQTTKNTIFLVLFALFFGLNLSAQENSILFDKNGSRWSLGVKGGIDYFFVNPPAESDTKLKTAVIQASWTGLIFGEYTFNKIFSLGLESGYLAYNRGGSKGSYAGGTIDATLYASFNFSNMAKKDILGASSRVSWYGNIGAGGSYYHYKNSGKSFKEEGKGFAPLAFAGVTCAVNLTNNWELFAEAQYRAYIAKNMGGENVKAFTNAFAAFLGVRYKIF